MLPRAYGPRTRYKYRVKRDLIVPGTRDGYGAERDVAMPPVSIPPPAPRMIAGSVDGFGVGNPRWLASMLLVVFVGIFAIVGMVESRCAVAEKGETRAAVAHASSTESGPVPNNSEGVSAQPSDGEGDSKSLPRETTMRRYGPVWLVRLGVTSLRLRASLRIQRTLAEANGEHLLLMVTGEDCPNCEAFISLLTAPSLQERLGPARIVRVDAVAFEQELKSLRVPTDVRAAFFLLDEQLGPRDGIHHREWTNADDPREVGKVLARFIHGRYAKRRYEWSPVRGSLKL